MDHNTGTVSQFLDKLCYLLHGCNCEFSHCNFWRWISQNSADNSYA